MAWVPGPSTCVAPRRRQAHLKFATSGCVRLTRQCNESTSTPTPIFPTPIIPHPSWNPGGVARVGPFVSEPRSAAIYVRQEIASLLQATRHAAVLYTSLRSSGNNGCIPTLIGSSGVVGARRALAEQPVTPKTLNTRLRTHHEPFFFPALSERGHGSRLRRCLHELPRKRVKHKINDPPLAVSRPTINERASELYQSILRSFELDLLVDRPEFLSASVH
jgi:hypothetical protein